MWKQRLLQVGGHLGLDRAALPLWRGSLLVLMYHRFEGNPRDALAVDPQTFARHMRHVARRGRVLPLRAALDLLFGGEALPPGSVAITVDDGGADFERVWPVVEGLRVPVTLAVCPGFAGGGREALFGLLHAHLRSAPGFADALARHLGVEELPYERCFELLWPLSEAEMAKALESCGVSLPVADGPVPGSIPLPVADFATLRAWARTGLVEVASHTMSHPTLPRVHGDWLRWELEQSKTRLETEVGPCDLLFYPGGARPRELESDPELLRKAGYRYGLAGRPGFVRPGSQPHGLPRVAIQGGEPHGLFRMRAAGWPALLRG